VSLFIARTDRLGLVGPNGAGKSTLFGLILGEEKPDTGTIEWERGADFGFLPQESAPAGDETILHIATSGKKLEPTEDDYDIDYTLEPRARKILAGLGFKEGDADKLAKTFSGGWVMRAHLARLLVAEPALLLLDEPTNHLDLEALLWFQDYLTRYPGGLVVISHDRAFLNALCTGMLELRAGTLHYYHGNYDNFLKEKEARKAQQAAAFKNQQREIAHLQKFVDRFGAKASMASRAKSKEKQIERLQEVAVEEPTEELKRINFKFPQPPRSGLKVIELEHVQQAYGNHVVYRDLNFTAERGQRIVLVGPNGAGKSTLLKILADVIPIQGGTRELGSNVVPATSPRTASITSRPTLTVFENVMSLRTAENQLTEQQARAILGAFLFRKDDVHKPVSVLSGGEKSRLALARLLVKPPNLLLMDEPTTHLDIQSIDSLVGALKNYEGTLIFISHDVHFIKALAENVLHVHSGRLTPYAGNYDYYLEKSKATDARAALTAGFTDAAGARNRGPAPEGRAQGPPTSPQIPHAASSKPKPITARDRPRSASSASSIVDQVGQLEKPVKLRTRSQAGRDHRRARGRSTQHSDLRRQGQVPSPQPRAERHRRSDQRSPPPSEWEAAATEARGMGVPGAPRQNITTTRDKMEPRPVAAFLLRSDLFEVPCHPAYRDGTAESFPARSATGRIADDRLRQHGIRLGQRRLIVGMHEAKRPAGLHLFAHLHQRADPHRRINAVFRLGAARPEAQGGQSHAHRIDLLHKPTGLRRQRFLPARLRQLRGIINDGHVAALRPDDLAKLRQRRAARNRLLELPAGRRLVRRHAAHHQHLRRRASA
jgi:ATP-binding cassette subfamily F protein 3